MMQKVMTKDQRQLMIEVIEMNPWISLMIQKFLIVGTIMVIFKVRMKKIYKLITTPEIRSLKVFSIKLIFSLITQSFHGETLVAVEVKAGHSLIRRRGPMTQAR